MAEEHFFSDSYMEARQRFLEAAHAAGAAISTYRLDAADAKELAIDIAVAGENDAPALVVSSGIHGIEGFCGSAIQLALLERLKVAAPASGIRIVLIHSINPYGFDALRRANEDNADLNRNFLADGKRYSGAPAGYVALDAFLNPPTPPPRFEPFRLKARWKIRQMGLQPLLQAIAQGQYEYPRGIFFGGAAPCASTRIIQSHCDSWVAAAKPVVHIDLHTGLGKFGGCSLLLADAADTPGYHWCANTFDAGVVEAQGGAGSTAYATSGDFGEWMQQHFRSKEYCYVCAEFGTYPVVRVLAALRAENRAHHFSAPDRTTFQRAKQELMECFCPSSLSWRRQVVSTGLHITERAINKLMSTTGELTLQNSARQSASMP